MPSVRNVISWQSALWHHVPLVVLRCKLFRVDLTGQELWPSHNVYFNALPVILHHITFRTWTLHTAHIYGKIHSGLSELCKHFSQYLCICAKTLHIDHRTSPQQCRTSIGAKFAKSVWSDSAIAWQIREGYMWNTLCICICMCGQALPRCVTCKTLCGPLNLIEALSLRLLCVMNYKGKRGKL